VKEFGAVGVTRLSPIPPAPPSLSDSGIVSGLFPFGHCLRGRVGGTNMEPIDIVHFVVVVNQRPEVWEGNGFYIAPDGSWFWENFGRDVADAIQHGLVGLVDMNRPFRIRVEGERYMVHGPLAASLRKRIGNRLRSDPACFTWEPVMTERIVLGKGANRG